MTVHVKISGRDEIWLDTKTFQLRAIGCLPLLELVEQWRGHLKNPLDKIPLPQGADHASLLLKEAILRAQSRWQPPYADEELCHCRGIPTQKVNESIVAGSHSTSLVSQETSASTACGTCRPDVEKQIEYILKIA